MPPNTTLREAAKEYLVRYGADAFPNLFVAAKGTIVRDDTGREILDFTSGQMCATVGHNHPAVVAAVHAAGEKAFHFFSGMIPEVVAELARTLAQEWMPRGLTRSLFVSTGAESNEAALRMAKLHTGGYEVLAVGGSWHGVTGGTSTPPALMIGSMMMAAARPADCMSNILSPSSRPVSADCSGLPASI